MTVRITLNRAEAAEACGVSPATISAAVASGRLKAKRSGENGGGNYMIRPADLDAWIDSMEDA